jgi:hypothetical protein
MAIQEGIGRTVLRTKAGGFDEQDKPGPFAILKCNLETRERKADLEECVR